jgi:hypothetical protein
MEEFRRNLAAFWRNDYAPLQAASEAVLQALRDDENNPDADLYRAMSQSGAGSHLYYRNSSAISMPAVVAGNDLDPAGNMTNGTAGSPFSPAPTTAMNQPTSSTCSIGSRIRHVKSVPLPAVLSDMLRKGGFAATFMGLHSEAQMAWLSIDHTVFLWSYGQDSPITSNGAPMPVDFALPPEIDDVGHSATFVSYTVPSHEPILAVGLVRPLKGS